MDFKLSSEYRPTGDQPEAIAQLTGSIRGGSRHSTLLGVTGSGKTFTVANVIANLNRPTLVLSHNKTLAAQLYSEFRGFFPENSVEYFVSYYDYYQPEAYLPQSDTYIEKDLQINDEIDKLRLRATAALMSGRRDVIVVASVSCIYGIGNPEDFEASVVELQKGQVLSRKKLLYDLVDILYTRSERDLTPATFRVNGDTLDVMLAYGETAVRLDFFDDEIEAITRIDPATGQRLEELDTIRISPANLFVTTKEKTTAAIRQIQLDLGEQIKFFEGLGRYPEAQRIKQRTEFDLEMIKELGYCSGIENYSRYFDGRRPGMPPFCLLNYFPDDYLLVVDESHVTLPQVRAMYGGDKARKENLVEYGFRLPAAKDNRPLTFDEFERLAGTSIYVSATPADYELTKSEGVVVEQVVRPTGVVDPPIQVRVTDNQIDDLIEEIQSRAAKDEKVLVATLTKRMAEELSKYFDRIGIRNRYIHSEVETLDRIRILEELRAGSFDVLIGVNLLREGLDLPEVSLVAVMDADKEGFLRNTRSITQIAGRAARHADGNVILSAEKRTDSIREAIAESNRRREKQIAYNIRNRIVPFAAKKTSRANVLVGASGATGSGVDAVSAIASAAGGFPYDFTEAEMKVAADVGAGYAASGPGLAGSAGVADGTSGIAGLDPKNLESAIAAARAKMEAAAKKLDFVEAARWRNIMYASQERLAGK